MSARLSARVRRVAFVAALLVACGTPGPGGTPPSDPPPAAPRGVSVPFRLIDNRIWVDAFIDDAGPFRFAFDTGGANALTPEVAARLGLATQPAGEATGAGEAAVPYARTRVGRFRIGALVLPDQQFMVLDTSPIQRAFGFAAFDGLFGFEVLARYAVRIQFHVDPADPALGLLTFTEDVEPSEVAGFDRVPFTLVADKPVVAAVIDGIPARVLLDTGDRTSLTVLTAFLAHPAIGRVFADRPEQVTGYGIGGPIPAKLGVVGHLQWCPRCELRDVVARQPTTKAGFNALTTIDASLGNEVLRQFTVVFDYRRGVAYFAPNAQFGTPTRFTPVPFPPTPDAPARP